jgi:hypothetical protein
MLYKVDHGPYYYFFRPGKRYILNPELRTVRVDHAPMRDCTLVHYSLEPLKHVFCWKGDEIVALPEPGAGLLTRIGNAILRLLG